MDKTCATWVIYNEKTSREEVERQREKLKEVGFEYVVKNIQYTTDISKHQDIIQRNLTPLIQKAKKTRHRTQIHGT